ncbi:MAG: cell division topological specificity factor MinE [Chloroflexi bacterium]|nr:cell division topological specificity factor MinE [Chloroflexota bacterium]
MTNLLSRLFGRTRKGSGATAKDRLRFVLQHDRINLPPERMEEMKREILAVIVKYLVVDQDRVEIDLEQRDRTHSKLTAEIPFAIHSPTSANKAVENTVAAADSAGANGANNGADADSAEAEADSKPEAADPPEPAKDEKADARGDDQEEADQKS